VVAVPLAVDVGDTLPQGAAEHDSVQVTPLLARSLPTVAVSCTVVPASTVTEMLERLTLICGGGVLVPPPQPTRTVPNRHPHAIRMMQTLFLVHITRTPCLCLSKSRSRWLGLLEEKGLAGQSPFAS
jgi:hypothetical protein